MKCFVLRRTVFPRRLRALHFPKQVEAGNPGRAWKIQVRCHESGIDLFADIEKQPDNGTTSNGSKEGAMDVDATEEKFVVFPLPKSFIELPKRTWKMKMRRKTWITNRGFEVSAFHLDASRWRSELQRGRPRVETALEKKWLLS